MPARKPVPKPPSKPAAKPAPLAAAPPPIQTDEDLAAALGKLLAADPRLEAVRAVAGSPPLRKRAGGLEGLMRIVVSQQLSTSSAEAIWGRLRAAYEPFEHGALLLASETELRAVGLSGPKMRTVRAIAQAVGEGRIDFDTLATASADEAHAMLTAVHGIGPWTADIYLLFCLGHPDAWPAGDLALQEGARAALNLDARPSAKELVALAEGWRPWRGVAARLLWAYYGALKRREGAPA